ncbi:flagellin N-terminal helical domain-containing protein [Geomesophilobacter sediminis]|uniref:Flagellin n=1 Tax=Geomesophilobacter sediminis TaxID=2798584 RepID=A0A8J7LYB8_9BACT|nr:flagellin [Geomesophilobacter sediminis]MBJ6724507.1 hypothetical protein [Geomesophilobacter sediminis]
MLTFNSFANSSSGALMYLGRAQNALSQSMERLSSGLRINSAADDAAGLAISVSMEARIRSARQGIRNAYDGISLVQVADGALGQVSQNIQRIRELAVQAASDPLTDSDRQGIQAESDQLVSDIKRISSATQFNGIHLLNRQGNSITLQTGAESTDTRQITLGSTDPDNLGLKGSVPVNGGMVDTSSLANPATAFTGANALVINGQPIAIQDDGVSTSFGVGSALAISNGINASGIGGLSASASAASVNLGGVSYTGVPAAGAQFRPIDFSINGAAVGGVTWDPLSGTSLGSAVAAQINTLGAGVSANYVGGQLLLTAPDGRNIEIATGGGSGNLVNFGGFNIRDGSPKDKTFLGDVVLTTDTPVRINHGISAAAGQGRTLASGTYPSPLSGSGVMLSAQSARDYLQVLDASLDQVSALRSQVGAMENVLGFTVANAENGVANLTASRSRIVDADLAVETANLTKAQILEQAGIAVVAQAGLNAKNLLSMLIDKAI